MVSWCEGLKDSRFRGDPLTLLSDTVMVFGIETEEE